MNSLKNALVASLRHLNKKRNISGTSALGRLITVKTNDEFASKVMASENPVIVNFHADWCEPCHILTPKMRELVENNENIDLAIIDVENHAQLVHDFEVQAVPAVLAVRNGLVVDKFVGLVDADMIEKLITKLENKIK